MEKLKKALEIVYKYRYILAIIVLIFCVIFEINGSSIGCWNYFFENSSMNDGVLIGNSRRIRSDEWIVNTPYAFSQYYNDFAYNSDIPRAYSNTDMFIIYGQPVKDISIIFRIFYIGYLFLSPAKGLSFFWCARAICLLLVTFEFLMLLTNKNRKLSLAGSFLIAFSPVIEWWFAVNYLVEMILFAELAIIAIDKFMLSDNFKIRALCISVVAWSAGNFVLCLYPAWLISMVYIFLPVLIWVIYKNFRTFKITKKDVIVIIINFIILALLLGRILIKSQDAIKLMMNTVYPGKRCETGGEGAFKLLISNIGLIAPFFKYDTFPVGFEIQNLCELVSVIDFLPITIIIISTVIFKDKVKDFLLNISIIFSLFLNIYCTIGFPEILAKITLLSNVPTSRIAAVIGILNLFILLRCITLQKSNLFNKKLAILISVFVSINIAFVIYKTYEKQLVFVHLFILLITTIPTYYFLLQIKTEGYDKYFAIASIIIALLSSVWVNPMRSGLDVIENNELGKEIVRINNEEQGVWVTQDINGNFPIMYGLKCINSINTYPTLDRWHKLDPSKKYEDVYNRYAHITIEIDNVDEAVFEQGSDDSFLVRLNIDDLEEIGVKYIISQSNYIDERLNKISNVQGYSIYKILEKEEVK